MKFKVKLRLTDASGTRKKYSINLEDGVKFMIGRGTPGLGSDLSHPSVSSQHCFLSVKDHLVWVTDNQSRNGTFLNQKRVDSASVRIGDMLQIGEYVIEFLEAPMPAKKESGISTTQFIDIAEMSEEERAALGRASPAYSTQVMNRPALFNRSRSIDLPKLKKEEAEREAAAAAADSSIAKTKAPEMFSGELTPQAAAADGSLEGAARQSSSIDLAALDSESAVAKRDEPVEGPSISVVESSAIPFDEPRDSLLPTTMTELPPGKLQPESPPLPSGSIKSGGKSKISEAPKPGAISDRQTDEIKRAPAATETAATETETKAPASAKPPKMPESFMPAELMPTGMIQTHRTVKGDLQKPGPAHDDDFEEEEDTGLLESPKVVTKSEISAPFAKPLEDKVEEEEDTGDVPPLPELTAAATALPPPPKPALPKLGAIPPAPVPPLGPSRRKEDSPADAPAASVASSDDDRKKNELVSKHLKKPPLPLSSPGNKRATDRREEPPAHPPMAIAAAMSAPDPAAARAAQPPSARRMSRGSPAITSSVIAFASFAVCGGAVAAMGGGPLHLWIPPLYGAVGTAMIAGLAWLLNHYNEFMEADGDFRDYHRMLALASIPVVLLGALSHASMLYRLPAYVLYGVIFFNVFITRFKPLAERFFFLAGSYVASFTFVVYVATSWDTIMTSANAPNAGQDVAATETVPLRTPAEVVHPAAEPTAAKTGAPVVMNAGAAQNGGAAQNQAPVPDNNGTQAQTAKPEPDSFAMSELLTAAQQGDPHIVHSLIADKGVNPNTVAENGMTALMYAAYNGHLEVAKALIGSHADANMRDRQGTSALMWAAYNGKQDMTAYLIQSGADLGAHRNDGDTALDIAKRWEHSDPPHAAERAEVVHLLENPAYARSARIPIDLAAKPAPAPQTVRVTPPPTHHVAARHTNRRTPASKAKRSKTKKSAKSEKYSATTSDDDDSDARARAVRSLKIGQ